MTCTRPACDRRPRYRQLDHWVRAGYLHPTNPQPGSGVSRGCNLTAMNTVQQALATCIATGLPFKDGEAS